MITALALSIADVNVYAAHAHTTAAAAFRHGRLDEGITFTMRAKGLTNKAADMAESLAVRMTTDEIKLPRRRRA